MIAPGKLTLCEMLVGHYVVAHRSSLRSVVIRLAPKYGGPFSSDTMYAIISLRKSTPPMVEIVKSWSVAAVERTWHIQYCQAGQDSGLGVEVKVLKSLEFSPLRSEAVPGCTALRGIGPPCRAGPCTWCRVEG